MTERRIGGALVMKMAIAAVLATGVLALVSAVGAIGTAIASSPATRPILGADLLTATTRPYSDKPITALKPGASPIGDDLLKWWAEGTAAGNVGDWYDNRDRGHSLLNVSLYPQLQVVTYSKEEIKQRLDWAFQKRVLPMVVFGNSSTAATVLEGGSNPRQYYTVPQNIRFLYTQYIHNNLYIYPEHRDYKKGHNGDTGYGDLFPTNTPFLITSQGSSGTDMPFMQALPVTLAAFEPEVKKKLVESGLLMPTVQMIFRYCNKQLENPATDYLTGKAHPPVFEGPWVNAQKMVEMAHRMQPSDIPPMVQLRVVDDDRPAEGRDFFEPGRTELLAETPAVIARVFRGAAYARRMVVSAETSYDLNKRPLTYTWVVLRGDAQRIKIKPMNNEGSVVEIYMPYQERYAPEKDGIETNRVDIGVFVHNGAYYSAPGFVTWFFLDHEARTYDKQGRILEIGYGVGRSDLTVTNWQGLMDLLATSAASAPGLAPVPGLASQGGTRRGAVLRTLFSDQEAAAVAVAAREYKPAEAALDQILAKVNTTKDPMQKAEDAFKAAETRLLAARQADQVESTDKTRAALTSAQAALQAAEAERKRVEGLAFDAKLGLDGARKAVSEILSAKRDGASNGVEALLKERLLQTTENPRFYLDHASALDELYRAADAAHKAPIDAARKQLVRMGIIAAKADELVLQPLLQGDGPPTARLTRYELSQLQRFQAEVLVNLLTADSVTVVYTPFYVDPRIASDKKTWRDVYRYNDQGQCTGWMRYDLDGVRLFDSEGQPAPLRP